VNPEEQLRVARELMRAYRTMLRRQADIAARIPASRLSSSQRATVTAALASLEADFRATDPVFRDALAREDGAEALTLARGRWDADRRVLAAASSIIGSEPWYARLLGAVERAAAGAADGAAEALRVLGGGVGVGLVVGVVALLLFAGGGRSK
jgi:hypothetical protein